MKALKGFWQFLNTDVKDIPWGDIAEQGIEVITNVPDVAQAWKDHAPQIQQLAPYLQQVEPLIKALDNPVTQLTLAGLPFVSIGINVLKLGLDMAKVDPTFEGSVAIVAQLAYLQSLETVLGRIQDDATQAKLAQLSLKAVIERQLTRLDAIELTTAQAKQVTTTFRESELALAFGDALAEQLRQAGLLEEQTRRCVEQVAWGSRRYVHQAMVEAGDSVAPLAEFYRTGGQQAQERYASLDEYVEEIKKLLLDKVFDEPTLRYQDIYVRLQVQSLTQDGWTNEDAEPLCSHEWTRQILEQPADQPRKVMFVEGDAGRGKSVFCRMIANWVHEEFGDAFIPIRIRLRDLRKLANNLTETLEDCPDLEQRTFVRGKADWLADKNTRFLIILDGFDELLLEGRATGGLKEFLQQVTDFQRHSHHQLLVTGRPLALQGIDRLITQNRDLERVRLEPITDDLREQWLINWQAVFGEDTVNTFRQFLEACPTDITDTLAREPLLLYLLARLNREGDLSPRMFADTQAGANPEMNAKRKIYQASVDWVLKEQRQQKENLRLSGLDDLDDLREVLQEAALCVVQSGNETARLEMVKQRFKDSSNPINNLLKQAQENTGQSEDKSLNNLLTAFYLKPGETDRQGSVEFAHKSFGEYLFAERIMAAFEDWTAVDQKRGREKPRLDDRALYEQIYDVFGYGGLSQEIVAYLWELLAESNLDRVRLFHRLHGFYQRWHQSEFLDAPPNENLPQKKFLQLLDQDIPTELRQVDVFAGLNVLIMLFKLHAAAQPKDYRHVLKGTPRPEIWFHPCGDPETESFERNRLLNIIHYADALGVGTFAKTVGPFLASVNLCSVNLCSANLYNVNLDSADLDSADLVRANLYNANLYNANLARATLYGASLIKASLLRANLSRANLYSAYLDSANLSKSTLYKTDLESAYLYSADLSSAYLENTNLKGAFLFRANLDRSFLLSANLDNTNLESTSLKSALLIATRLRRNVQNLRSEQLEGQDPPLLCDVALPPDLNLDPNRDRDRLAEVLHERYPSRYKTVEQATEWMREKRLC